MPHALALIALVPAMAAVHRIRGGGLVALPIKGTYVLWPIPGLLAIAAGAPWPVALAWALGYLAWTLPGWMAFLTRAVGAPVPANQVMGAGLDVRLVWALARGDAVAACLVRAALYLLPLGIALACLDVLDAAGPLSDVAPLALIVAVFLPAYTIGYRLRPTDMSSVAEPIVGASWGVALALSLWLAGA